MLLRCGYPYGGRCTDYRGDDAAGSNCGRRRDSERAAHRVKGDVVTDSTEKAKPPRRVLRRIVIIGSSILGVLVLGVGSLVLSFLAIGWQSERDQIARVEARSAEVAETTESQRADWSDPAADSSVTESLPYNRMQVIGTHNSYVIEPSWLQTRVIDLVEPGQGATLQYSHAPVWDQLEAGIRSMEIDIRWNGESFSVSHVPLVANSATIPDFELGLREIALWSDAHPAHLPISIIIEPKEDYVFLDPGLKPFDAAACDALDAVIAETMGERLFAPGDLLGAAPTLRAAVADDGWPTVGELRGSVLFFFADNETLREECSGAADLGDRAVFPSSKTGADEAVFAVRDDPRDPGISADLAAGLIVRVRVDADVSVSTDDRDFALDTGAQILSTDFPLSEPQAGTGYLVQFPGGYLARAVR